MTTIFFVECWTLLPKIYRDVFVTLSPNNLFPVQNVRFVGCLIFNTLSVYLLQCSVLSGVIWFRRSIYAFADKKQYHVFPIFSVYFLFVHRLKKKKRIIFASVKIVPERIAYIKTIHTSYVKRKSPLCTCARKSESFFLNVYCKLNANKKITYKEEQWRHVFGLGETRNGWSIKSTKKLKFAS